MAIDELRPNTGGLYCLDHDMNNTPGKLRIVRMLCILALIGAVLGLGLSIYALNKAGAATNNVMRIIELSENANSKK